MYHSRFVATPTSLEREDMFLWVWGTHCLITANSWEMVVLELEYGDVGMGERGLQIEGLTPATDPDSHCTSDQRNTDPSTDTVNK